MFDFNAPTASVLSFLSKIQSTETQIKFWKTVNLLGTITLQVSIKLTEWVVIALIYAACYFLQFLGWFIGQCQYQATKPIALPGKVAFPEEVTDTAPSPVVDLEAAVDVEAPSYNALISMTKKALVKMAREASVSTKGTKVQLANRILSNS